MNNLLGVGSRVKHPAFGDGVIIRLHIAAYEVCFWQYGIRTVGKEYSGWEVVDKVETEESITFSEAEKSLAKVLRAFSDITEVVKIADKWKDGTMVLQPADQQLQSKEVPIETFFHKIVMVRDRIRVMEQKVNASKLSEEDKIDMQQYITRIYGSLTTFNVLFKEKDDYFVGEKSK